MKDTMDFNYECNSDDLYLVDEGVNGKTFKPNRSVIRSLVVKENLFYTTIVSSGGNKHQAELDVGDALVELLTSIAARDSSLAKSISDVFAEERVANSLNALDGTAAEGRLQQAKETEKKSSLSNKVILTIVLLVSVLFISMVIVMGR
ncbi:hypothetical protein MWS75_004433 [Serratia marcescens]|uniref:hypothetical protein n=1 Tax=Serratia marcescens TaxID=615 RepID=UPI00309C0378|nr:hypothetical protein [Serratia marcescens]EJA2552339.1 hypothetical protein [Serratia marcescens]EJA2596985.1 hypothetical protein [Serratia marcescens]